MQGTGTQGQVSGEPTFTIKDFGVVAMEDRTFSASVSFDAGQDGPTATPSSGSGDDRALPATGGSALAILLAGGALMAVGGILARRLCR